MAKKSVRSAKPASAAPAPAATPKRRTSSGGAKRDAAASAPLVSGDGEIVSLETANDMKVQGDVDSAETRTPTYEEIAEAAYRRYLERGGDHGRDFDDWVEAERALRSK
jgi:hypothetical protein